MDRETLGKILGWIIVTVTAWFLALAVIGYTIADIFPWHWTAEQRGIHLGLQMLFIAVYALLTRPVSGKK